MFRGTDTFINVIIAIGMASIVVALALLVYAMFTTSDLDDLREQALERGYMEYCPKTGDLAWKGECGD